MSVTTFCEAEERDGGKAEGVMCVFPEKAAHHANAVLYTNAQAA
ncbi:hypothetical protein [Nonomuraea sp. NPDC049784]